ncbi:MAG: hypothetical protein P8078_02145 [bacterium]
MKNTLVLALISLCLLHCTNYNEINIYHLQGFYKYQIYQNENHRVIDTLYTAIIVKGMYNADSIKSTIDLLGPVIITKNKILGIWDIKTTETNENKAECFTIYKTHMDKNESWSLENELGFEVGSFQRNFKCLSIDTSISLTPEKSINNIVLLEQKDLIDVGGFWEVRHYGFNKEDQIVYYSEYVQNPRDTSIIKKKNFLILNNFYFRKEIKESEYKKWLEKNSKESRKFLN